MDEMKNRSNLKEKRKAQDQNESNNVFFFNNILL